MKVLKPFCAHIRQQLKHWLIDHLGKEALGCGMYLPWRASRGRSVQTRRGGHSRLCGCKELHYSRLAASQDAFDVSLQDRGERFLGFPFLMLCGASALIRSIAKMNWKYSGCSAHSVPSLSKVAMRSAGRDEAGEPGVVTAATKSMMDCLVLPSTHDGSGSAARAMAMN